MDRIERVALAWDAPVRLELHALEFGAGLGSSGHVFSGNAKDFSSVRRSGGGYLTRFAAVGGIGQSVEIYTHWRGGATGVVRMMIDFSSRHRDQQAGTCGTGPLAAPAFTIYRSSGGELERPLNRRLSAMDCSRVASTTSHLIEAAVDDVIVTGR
jgi:hypothetical protein